MVLKEDRKSVKAHVAMVILSFNLNLAFLNCFSSLRSTIIDLSVLDGANCYVLFLLLYRVKNSLFLLTCKFVLFVRVFLAIHYIRREKKSGTRINSRSHKQLRVENSPKILSF